MPRFSLFRPASLLVLSSPLLLGVYCGGGERDSSDPPLPLCHESTLVEGGAPNTTSQGLSIVPPSYLVFHFDETQGGLVCWPDRGDGCAAGDAGTTGEPCRIDLGEVPVGETRQVRVGLHVAGTLDLAVDDISFTVDSDPAFSLEGEQPGSPPPGFVDANSTEVLTVVVSPTFEGEVRAHVVVEMNAANIAGEGARLEVVATGVAP